MNIFGKFFIFFFLQLLYNFLIIWEPLRIDNFSDLSFDSPLNHPTDCDVLSFYPASLFVFTFTFVDIWFKCQLLFIFFILHLNSTSVFSFLEPLFADLVEGLWFFHPSLVVFNARVYVLVIILVLFRLFYRWEPISIANRCVWALCIDAACIFFPFRLTPWTTCRYLSTSFRNLGPETILDFVSVFFGTVAFILF